MATLSSTTLVNQTPRFPFKASASPNLIKVQSLNRPWRQLISGFSPIRIGVDRSLVVAAAAPDSLSEKVAKSVQDAEGLCSDKPESGECVAAWDEVEELSAAASHARDKKKTTTPLDEFCKDNPNDEECRTYED
ncbi:calvin cycle protein CP12-1, chloroplastic-like [Impatiens glandulifera]|uniref:calvin cycle protein CP12-1, chloroplastic-like n=1 Tax=Impatiens glandulifera TaxID=253017 RepID=UPI001FB1593C|nr:calvin cycle protein CP12-1, chloroplastic-like [Impatiens glandulifera]